MSYSSYMSEVDLLQREGWQNEAEAHVKRGAKWLDEWFGEERWFDDVNVNVLDIDDDHDCVLGQLFGSFEASPYYELPLGRLRLYGFVSGGLMADPPIDMLNEAWVALINQRKATP